MKKINLFKPCIYPLLWLTLTCQALAISAHNVLVSYTVLGDFSRETGQQVLNKTPGLDSLQSHFDLQLYKINYKTQAPDGSLTLASGLVAMPQNPVNPVAIVSYQHGTRFERNDVPSRNNEKNYIYLAAYGNSAGYMTVMPDYLGLGDNELPIHPYVQADTLAQSSIDMLFAAKELSHVLNYPLSDKLYLAGYSEGGFSTVVMFEKLAKDYPDISITAVAPGSAPFGLKETMTFVMLDPGPRATAYLAYFFYSLQHYLGYWSGYDEIFAPPYNQLIPELMDGQHTTLEILKSLPQNPQLIFQASFAMGILGETDKNMEALQKNFNHYEFKPTAPLLLVGTKGDHDVPFSGAEMAYQFFRKYSDQVWIKSVSDTLDHVQAHPYILKEQIDFFKQYDMQ